MNEGPTMNARDYIAEKYRQLEELLRNRYGAQGISLGTRAQSLKGRLPEQILSKILEVNSLRNGLQHCQPEKDAKPEDPETRACRELFNTQRKVDYILKACSYPEVVLNKIDVAFKELENERERITVFLGSPLGIKGNTLEDKLNNVENKLSVEVLWKLCQFRDYFERAANDDFADALRYSEQAKSLYDELSKALKDINALPKEILPQERYTTDKINDDVKLIDEKSLEELQNLSDDKLSSVAVEIEPSNKSSALAIQASKTDEKKLEDLLKLNDDILSNVTVETLSSPDNSTKSHPQPTPSTSSKTASSTDKATDLETVEKMQDKMLKLLGAQLHCAGKTLRTKIDSLKQQKGVSKSVIQKLSQFEKETAEVLTDKIIKPDTVDKLRQLAQEISPLLQSAINAIRTQNASAQKK